jgi:uncharacterized protein (UPF0210 family)
VPEGWSRRQVVSTLATGVAAAGLFVDARSAGQENAVSALRIRTITAGVELKGPGDSAALERALARAVRARKRVQDAGFEVQTIRVASNPIIAPLDAGQRDAALRDLQKLDALALAAGAVMSIGPVLIEDRFDTALGQWAASLARETKQISCSVDVVSSSHTVQRAAVQTAAHVIAALSKVDPSGVANFRFAAAASIPNGTPFFPVARHLGPDSLAIGVESAGVVQSVAANQSGSEDRLREALDTQLAPIETFGSQMASAERVQFLGIDPSPAPGLDRSIGAAIEAFTGFPFGHPSTLQACAIITGALKALKVRTCGYAGLMLPVLEDPVLAKRASEQRYGIQELLLYSTVCGTGLDVVPLAGDIAPDDLARIIGDVATLAARLRKPLSARLFPVPGHKAGDTVSFKDPLLTACRVFDL